MGSGGHSTFIPWKVSEPCLAGSNPGRHFVEMRFFIGYITELKSQQPHSLFSGWGTGTDVQTF